MSCLIPKNFQLKQRQYSHQQLQQIPKQMKGNMKGNNEMNKQVENRTLINRIELEDISAKQYIVVDRNNGKVLIQHNANIQRECASLTKIMTCYLCILVCEQWKVDMNELYVQVSKKAGRMIGTSANLQKNSWISLWDLMYGMMLPSGNDSALCVAENIGYIATLSREELKRKMMTYQQIFGDNQKDCQQQYENSRFIQTNNQYNSMQFVQMMNEQAYFLNMNQSRFNNPHGLADRFNKSSPNDIGILGYRAMKHSRFREIVRTISYVSQHLDENGQNVSLQWENTNRLLQLRSNEWDGLKTGITCVAGPCLASSNHKHVIVLFNSKTMEARWKESQKLSTIASVL